MLEHQVFYGTHISSNIRSLINGFEERDLGISIARNSDEEMSSPTINDIGNGIKKRISVRVEGNGLDYNKDSDFIDDINNSVSPP